MHQRPVRGLVLQAPSIAHQRVMDIRLPKTTAASEVPSGGETIRLNRGFHVVGMYLSPSRHGNSWTPRLAENTSVYRKEGYHYDLWRFKNVHFITKANKFDHVNNINCPNHDDTLTRMTLARRHRHLDVGGQRRNPIDLDGDGIGSDRPDFTVRFCQVKLDPAVHISLVECDGCIERGHGGSVQ